MKSPEFKITSEAIRSFASTFDVPLAPGEAERLATQLAGGFGGIVDLWKVDVADCEPLVIFDVDRS